jgi:hypothetical protein
MQLCVIYFFSAMDFLLKTARLIHTAQNLRGDIKKIGLNLSIMYRRDICFSQALTTLVSSLMAKLWGTVITGKHLSIFFFYLLSSIFYLLSSIFYLLSSIFYLLSSIFYLLSSIFYLLSSFYLSILLFFYLLLLLFFFFSYM